MRPSPRSAGCAEARKNERSTAAAWAEATGDPAYTSAFLKWMADPQRGHMLWTDEEKQAYSRVKEVEQQRALGTGAGAGGEMIPLVLNPAILLDLARGSINPLRKIARVEQTTSSSWNGITSAGVTAEWKTEHDEAADATPTLAPVEVPVFLGDAFVPYSFEIEGDALQFARELAKLLVDAADQLQVTAFTTGNGTTEPQGRSPAAPARPRK